MEIPPTKNNINSTFPPSKVPFEASKNFPFSNFSSKTVVPASPFSNKSSEFIPSVSAAPTIPVATSSVVSSETVQQTLPSFSQMQQTVQVPQQMTQQPAQVPQPMMQQSTQQITQQTIQVPQPMMQQPVQQSIQQPTQQATQIPQQMIQQSTQSMTQQATQVPQQMTQQAIQQPTQQATQVPQQMTQQATQVPQQMTQQATQVPQQMTQQATQVPQQMTQQATQPMTQQPIITPILQPVQQLNHQNPQQVQQLPQQDNIQSIFSTHSISSDKQRTQTISPTSLINSNVINSSRSSAVISPFPDMQSSLLAKPQSPGQIDIFPDFRQFSVISFLPFEEKHPMKMGIFYDTDPQKSFYTNCLNYDQDKIKHELYSCLIFLSKKGLQNANFFNELLSNSFQKGSVSFQDKTKKVPEKMNDEFVTDTNGNKLFFYRSKKELNMKYIANDIQYDVIEGGLMFIVGKEPLNGDSGKILPGSILLFGNYYISKLQKQMYFRSNIPIMVTDNIINAFLPIVIDKDGMDKDGPEWALQSRTYFKSKNSGRRGYIMHSTITY